MFVAVVVLALLQSLASLGELATGAKLVSLLTADRTAVSAYATWVGLLGVLLAISGAAGAAEIELRYLLGERLHSAMVKEILHVATSVDLEDLETPEFHDRLLLATNNAHEQANYLVWGLMSLLLTLATTIAVGGLILSIAPVLFAIAAAAYLPLIVVHSLNGRALRALNYGLSEADRHRQYHERLLVGRKEARELRLLQLTGLLRSRHDALFDDRLQRIKKLVARRGLRLAVAAGTSGLIMAGAFGALVLLTASGRLSFAQAAVGIVGLRQLAGRFQAVGGHAGALVQGAVFLGDFAVFQTRMPAAKPLGLTEPPTDPSLIRLDHVSYRYPTSRSNALNDVSLDITRGQVVAVVGHNGSGKSTLVRLLLGLHRPNAGNIFWDDVDLANCDPMAVRSRVAAVFQDYIRFEHTVTDNIAFGDAAQPVDAARVRAAAQDSGAAGFVEGLAKGYDTWLSTAFQDGTEPSAGQWQRLAIARAMYRDAPFLVLDEPSAALDPIAEANLFGRLRTLAKGRTVVFVSHRFSTVATADRIVVLNEGHLVEAGTHQELIARDGLYAQMHWLQARTAIQEPMTPNSATRSTS